MDVRATVEHSGAFGVPVHCLALGGVDLASLVGKMTMQVINAKTGFEHDQFIERKNRGIKRISAEDEKLGWPFTVTNVHKATCCVCWPNGARCTASAPVAYNPAGNWRVWTAGSVFAPTLSNKSLLLRPTQYPLS
jgi:putative DNA-invertase from lambdoid prophage Rac